MDKLIIIVAPTGFPSDQKDDPPRAHHACGDH